MRQTDPSLPAANPRHFCWRRLVQFQLRTLLILMTIIAVGLGWWSHKARQQQQAVAAIRNARGQVLYDFENLENTTTGELPTWQEPIVKILGVDWVANVDEVSFVGCQEPVDAPLELVVGLSRLRRLNLCYTTLADDDLEQLAHLKSLQVLAIDHAAITDSGVEKVAQLKNLKLLGLHRTQLTDAGYCRLREHLPNCKIDRKWTLFGGSLQ